MICNGELCPNYFSVNVSGLTVVFRQKIFKKQRSLPEIVGSLKTVGKIQQLVRKRSQKTNYDVTALAVYLIFNKLTFFATSIIFLESTI